MARHITRRSKPKKRPNRYNPNNPDYVAVHMGLMGQVSRPLFASSFLWRKRR